MNRLAGATWQILLADLSLILFVTTAAALQDTRAPDTRTPAAPAAGEPVAIHVLGPGAPDLAQWLARQPPDSRQQLTLTLRYAQADLPALLDRAAGLARAAQAAGHAPRIVIEPGTASSLHAALAYDRAPELAQALQTYPEDTNQSGAD